MTSEKQVGINRDDGLRQVPVFEKPVGVFEKLN